MTLAKSVFWLAFAEILFYASGYVIHAGAGRILGPADYGRYGLIVTLTILITALIGNGIPIAMSKFLSEYFEKKPEKVAAVKKQAFAAQTILMVISTALFFLCAPLIAWLLRDPSLTPLFRLSAFIIPAYGFDTLYFYYFTGIHRFNVQSILKILRAIFRMIIILGLAVYFGLKGIISGYIFVPLVILAAAFFIDRAFYAKMFKASPKESFPLKKLLAYAIPITGFLLFYETYVSIDLYFVKAILGSDFQTGIYNAALTIGRIPNYLFYALTIILLPTVAQSYSAQDVAKARDMIAKALRFMILLLVPVCVIIGAYAKPVINIFFGSPYLGAQQSLKILIVGLGITTIFYVLSFAFKGAGLVKIPMYICLGGVFLNAILNLALVKKYGISGAAMATSISGIIITLILLYFAFRKFQLFFPFLTFIKSVVAGALIFYSASVFPAGNLSFIFSSVILFFLYLLALYVLDEIKKEDLNDLRKMLPFVGK